MDKKSIALIAIIIIGILTIGFYFTNTNNNESEADDNVVTIGHLPSDHDAALFVAKEKKMYESQGLQVETVQFNNGGDLITAMASGDVDVGYVGIAPVLSSISQKVPIKIVSGAQMEGSSIVANKNSGINTIADLKGKNVATPGEATIQYTLLSYALNQSGVSTNKVEFTTMKAAQMTDTLRAGRVDAMIIWEPYASIAVKSGAGKLIETSGQIVPEHPCCCVVARDEFIKKHNDKLQKILKAHENATKFINENPEEASNCLPDDIVPDKQLQKDIVANTTYIYGVDDNYKERVMDFMDLEIKLGILYKPLTENQLFADV